MNTRHTQANISLATTSMSSQMDALSLNKLSAERVPISCKSSLVRPHCEPVMIDSPAQIVSRLFFAAASIYLDCHASGTSGFCHASASSAWFSTAFICRQPTAPRALPVTDALSKGIGIGQGVLLPVCLLAIIGATHQFTKRT